MRRFCVWLAYLMIVFVHNAICAPINPYSDNDSRAGNAIKHAIPEHVIKLTEKKLQDITRAITREDGNYQITLPPYRLGNIPEETDKKIEKIKDEIKLLITTLALNYSEKKQTGNVAIENGDISYEKLYEAVTENNVTVSSIIYAVVILSRINKELMKAAMAAKDKDEKRNLYTEQAAFVYEMCDITLEIVNNLKLDGSQAIRGMHQDVIKRIEERRKASDKRKKKAKKLIEDGIISRDEYQTAVRIEDELQGFDDQILTAWTMFTQSLDNQEKRIDNVKKRAEIVKIKRDQAEHQLEILKRYRCAKFNNANNRADSGTRRHGGGVATS